MDRKLRKNKFIRNLISFILLSLLAPFIILLDLFVEVYHRIGFRLCKISLVKRKSYIKIDRHKLRYLNFLDKIGCVYCGYANGLAGYMGEIGARTEKYWCAIKHEKIKNVYEQKHQRNFLEYGDEKSFKKKYN